MYFPCSMCIVIIVPIKTADRVEGTYYMHVFINCDRVYENGTCSAIINFLKIAKNWKKHYTTEKIFFG